MAMPILLAPLVTWLVRDIVIKFLVLTGVFAVVALLVPKVVSLVTSFINPSVLSAAFGGIPPGLWYFLDIAQIGYGLPLLISAYVTRFLIRRMPLIG